ncbi:MAG: hypothetical protein KDA28_14325, partial [Phycisphaerales bacterium]|nr:hypothetical protein [Phycisphaerales bacterium]
MLIPTLVACTMLHPAPGIAVARDDTIYLADGPAHRIWMLRLGEDPVVFAEGADGTDFSVPHHLHVDAQGRVYAA